MKLSNLLQRVIEAEVDVLPGTLVTLSREMIAANLRHAAAHESKALAYTRTGGSRTSR